MLANEIIKESIKVSVGIPVYNEEKNIELLIRDILSSANIAVEKIIVYNDASTDNTKQAILRSIEKHGTKILFIDAKVNKGKSFGLQKIFEANTSPYLISLDSDIRVSNRDSLYKIVKPMFDNESVGITSGKYVYNESSSYMKRVFDFSTVVLVNVARKRPFYVCSGGLMAYSKKLTQQVFLPENIHRIDGYLYMQCIMKGYKFAFVQDAIVEDDKNFKSISLKEYVKIQARSQSFPSVFKTDFPSELLKNEIEIPKTLIIGSLVRSLMTHPLNGFIYITVKLYSKLANSFNRETATGKWRS